MFRPVLTLVWAFFAALTPGGLGCTNPDSGRCHVNADCASEACLANGRCAAPDPDGGLDAEEDGDEPASDSGDAAGNGDARDDRAGWDGDASAGTDARDGGEPGFCVPDHDGVFSREEAPLAAGLAARFRIATDTDVDTEGTDAGGGLRHWDLSGTLANDQDVTVSTQSTDGAWFEGDFDAATYSTLLDGDSGLYGVFRAEDDALELLGVVSAEDGWTRTELAYDPVVTVLSFPFAVEDAWTTDSTVTGYYYGLTSAGYDDYESLVDATGELETPYGTFDVTRIRVTLTRTVGISQQVIRSFLFLSECFGTIASITSEDNEPLVEFTHAAEVRRLTL